MINILRLANDKATRNAHLLLFSHLICVFLYLSSAINAFHIHIVQKPNTFFKICCKPC